MAKGRGDMTARPTGLGVMSALVLICVPAAQSQTSERGLGAILDELTIALQGEPIAVQASPVLCYPRGKQPARVADAEQWYFGVAGCELTYAPRQDALVTSVSEDLSRGHFAKKETQEHLAALLRELDRLVGESRLSPVEKLLVHSMAWEIAFGLKRMEELDPALKPALAPASCAAFRLLRRTWFSEREIAELGSNLTGLPAVVNDPRFRSAAEPLLQGKPGNLEVNRATELHAGQLLGRFTARIFLSVTNAKTAGDFQSFVTRSSTPYQELRDLPQRYDRFQAVLILYFNVLTEGWKIVPTGVVAGWQQYNLHEKSGFEVPLEKAAKNIEFLVVRAARDGSRLRYEVVDQAEMTRRSFLDVKPTFPGERVTSLRGHCLRCHSYSVATFDTHGARPVSLVKPFSVRTEQLMGQAYGKREAKLATWARECPDESKTVAAPKAAASRGERKD
jgi:hypothetical protein